MKPPLELPTDVFGAQEFELQHIDYSAPEAGGRVNGVQAGFPLWLGSWTVGGVLGDDTDSLRAFFSQIRGATRRFLGRDLLRLYPKAYPGGFDGMTRADTTAFDGTADSWSETITADGDSQVTLTNLPADFVLGQGDYIGFTWTATEASVVGLEWHAVVRVVEAGTADETGEVTVVSEPPIPSAVPSDAVAYLNEPACVMALVTDQSSLQALGQASLLQGGQITGIQDIRA